MGSDFCWFIGFARCEPIEKLTLKLTKTRNFGNGNVFLCYEPKVKARKDVKFTRTAIGTLETLPSRELADCI